MPALKLAGRFLALSGSLLVAVWATPLCDVLGSAVAAVGSIVLGLAWGPPIHWLLGPGSTIGLAIAGPAGYFRADIAALPMVRSVPLFVASVFAVGEWRAPRTWALAVIGACAVLVLDGIVLVAVVWPQLAQVTRIPVNRTYEILALARMNFGTGGLMVAPVFVGALASWTWAPRPATIAAGLQIRSSGPPASLWP